MFSEGNKENWAQNSCENLSYFPVFLLVDQNILEEWLREQPKPVQQSKPNCRHQMIAIIYH